MTILDTKNGLVHVIRFTTSLGYNGTCFDFECGGDFIVEEKWFTPVPPYPAPTCMRCVVKHVPA